MRAIRIILWSVVLLTLIGVVLGKMLLPKPLTKAPSPPQLYQTATLTLTDQDGKVFSTDSLRGHVWVADFIFTSCPGSCPIMSHQMAELQKKTPADVGFVSFTVDPKIDTPAVLREYGQSLHADFSRWHFLTGTDQQMKDAALGMKIAVQPAQGKFALRTATVSCWWDASGHVVGHHF